MGQQQTTPVILITGGSAGIGEAVARLFAVKGYRIALAARRAERMEAIATDLRQQGAEVLVLPTDVTRLEDIQRMVAAAIDRFGQIDLLFNNAGFGRLDWLEKLDPVEDVQAQVDVNLTGLIRTAQAVIPHMKARRSGHIINMSSIAGLVATPTYSVYAATKFGIRGFNDSLRRELMPFGIRVSGIYPGGVRTEFTDIARIRRKTGVRTPEFMRLEAEDVARAVWSLAKRPRRMLAFPWPLVVGVWGASLFPGITDWIMYLLFTRRERK